MAMRGENRRSSASKGSKVTSDLPFYVLVSSDEFLRRDWLLQLRSEREKLKKGCDIISYGKEDRTLEPAEVFDELRMPSLFGGHKVLVIEPADDFVRRNGEHIISYMKRPSGSATLVLSMNGMPSDRNLLKALKKAKSLISLGAPRGGELIRWVVERCSRYGKRIDSAAAKALGDRIGDKVGLLDSTIKRLMEQVGDKARITIEDVEGSVRDERVRARYELSAAIARGDKRGALASVQSLGKRRTASDVYRESIPYLANYAAQMKAIIRMIDQGMSQQEVEGAIGRRNAWFLIKEARSLPLSEIDRFADVLAKADYQMKTSGMTPGVLLETVVISLCSGPRRQANTQRRYY